MQTFSNRDPVPLLLALLQTFFCAGASLALVVVSSADSADGFVSFVAQAASHVANTTKVMVFFTMVSLILVIRISSFGHVGSKWFALITKRYCRLE